MAAPTPALLAMAAHGLYQWEIVPDWSKTKFDRMRGVLWAKFTQHPDLAALLISTGDSRLVETSTVDNPVNRLWGEVEGKGGRNILGTMLMEIRKRLSDGHSVFAPFSVTIQAVEQHGPPSSIAVVGAERHGV